MLLGLGDFFLPGGSKKIWEMESFEERKETRETSDKMRYERIRDLLTSAPHLGLGAPTIGWLQAASRSILHINNPTFAIKIKVPFLIIAAGNDHVVSVGAIEQFASRVKNSHLIVVAGARHEILQERDAFRDQFWAAFDTYIPGSNRTMSAGHLGI
jgi:lysophospholipase